jgi:hypothetical protein
MLPIRKSKNEICLAAELVSHHMSRLPKPEINIRMLSQKARLARAIAG